MGFSFSNKLFGGTGSGSSLPTLTGNANKVLTVNAGETGTEWAVGPAPAAAGSDTQVLFNDGGAIAGNAGLTFDKTTNGLSSTGPFTLTPTADVVPATFRAYSSGTNHIQQNQTSLNAVLSGWNHDGKPFLLADKGAGKVLTSDANGVASWQPPSSHVSAVPVMTSDTTPSGVASASSSHSTMAAWKAFIGPAGGWFNNGEAAPAWIQYQFPSARAITGYSIVPWSLDSWDAPSRQPLGWHLDGSNDGSSWTVLHTVAHTWPWQRWVKEYFGFTNATAYTHYRLVITDTGGNLYTGLQALELFQ